MLAVLDGRAPVSVRSALEALGHTVLPLPQNPRLPLPIASHTDALLFFFKRGCLLYEKLL